ncbi:MAG: class I fructose-bisphosphate aldolase [Anaerolineae bacterium]
MSGKAIRLSKLFPDGANTVIVAMDHGQTFGPMPGLVDFTAAAECLKEADAVLMAPQMIRFAGKLFEGKGSPSVIARLNWNTIHCEPWHYREAYIVKAMSVEAAVATGADLVLASLVLKTGSEEHDARNVHVFATIAEESYRLGVPLIGEVFPAGDLRASSDEFHDYIKKMCRIACELGADAIKTFYTGERFAEVVEGVPIPVFALGAEKLASELDALTLAHKAVSAGARGVVFGRNVLQAENPTQFLRRLKNVVQRFMAPEVA